MNNAKFSYKGICRYNLCANRHFFLLCQQDERHMKKLRSSQQQVHNPKPVRVAPPPQWVTPQTHQQHYQPAPDQKWMTPQTHRYFQDAGSQPYPHKFAPPPNWVTPEIPRGFFVSTSRLPSTPMEEGVSSSPACNSGGYPGVPHQCQSEATKPDPRTNPIATHREESDLHTTTV